MASVMTPREFLRDVRLRRAHADLTAHPEMSVTEIAYRWGFSTPSRFAAHHRETFGVSPSAMRNRPAN